MHFSTILLQSVTVAVSFVNVCHKISIILIRSPLPATGTELESTLAELIEERCMKKSDSEITAGPNNWKIAVSEDLGPDGARFQESLQECEARKLTAKSRPAIDDSKKKGLKDRLVAHLAAVAFAEAGQFETAEEMLQISKRLQTVLLVIEGEVPNEAAFNYAVKLCKRIRAEIDILQVIDRSDNSTDYDALSRRMSAGSAHIVALLQRLEREKVPFKITIRLGDADQKLFNYARRHKDVAVIIFDSPKVKKAAHEGKGWQELAEIISRQLSIPLVTVLEKQAMGLPSLS